MAFIQSQSLRSHLRLLALIAGGRRLRGTEFVIDDDKHYYRFEDDTDWAELVSARLVTGMRRKHLLRDGPYFEVTDLGHRLLREHQPEG